MVDAVAARARGAAFEADQLGGEPLVAEQPDLSRINVRQQIEIEDALGIFRGFVFDPTLCELLTRPFAGVAVALDLRDAVALQQVGEFLDHSLGENGGLTSRRQSSTAISAFRVGDGQA